MKFGRWYPLADAARLAPGTPGVFQVRLADGLVEYPRGKSAMVHYEAAGDVRAAAAAFAARFAGEPWWCRHVIEPEALEADAARALGERLMRDFAARFGHPPAPPAARSGAA